MQTHRMVRIAFAALAVGLCAGCAPANRDQLVKEALSSDPDFATVLDKHREISNRIKTFEREYALKRSTAERTISQLRRELTAASAALRAKTSEAKTRMEPDRKRLALALSMASEEIQTKQLQRASIGRSIANVQKAAKGGGETWSEKERAQQHAQLEQMQRDATRLDQEIDALRQHARLLKVKLYLLKL